MGVDEGGVMDVLKPCPFCGAVPTIRWEKWEEISDTSGIYVLEAFHKHGCYIRHMDGLDRKGTTHSPYKDVLINRWNTRIEVE